MLLFVLFACSGNSADSAADDTAGGLTGDATNGAVLFGETCAGCHGADGKGMKLEGGIVSADLSVSVPMSSDQSLMGVIQNGVGSAMPSQYTDPQDIADVIAYLRATFP